MKDKLYKNYETNNIKFALKKKTLQLITLFSEVNYQGH